MNIRAIVEVLFPAQCGGCGAAGTGLCEQCVSSSSRYEDRLPTLQLVALAKYEGRLRRAILALKSGRRDVAAACAQRLQAIVPPGAWLVPVPTTAARRRQRGFDGCDLIVRTIASSGAAVAKPGLQQVRGDRQRGRNRDARLLATGRFVWRGDNVQGANVTLVDDVATTGATLEDCARTLRNAGACVEQAIVIARA